MSIWVPTLWVVTRFKPISEAGDLYGLKQPDDYRVEWLNKDLTSFLKSKISIEKNKHQKLGNYTRVAGLDAADATELNSSGRQIIAVDGVYTKKLRRVGKGFEAYTLTAVMRSLNNDGELAKRELEKRACCIANFGSEENCALQQEKFVKERNRVAEANPFFKRDAQCSGICVYDYGACFEYCNCGGGTIDEAACGGKQPGRACSY
ncbi:hypothetical protein BOTNAR_0275g00110 [Botryotinia narcissicola]|uniref:Uncharacterized protein n=1 Tax=Botryotinia narcissicola TaxID=278944 RepID=A0A4Z1I5Y7_9HELO|nr:hypothetical protein BOTNAR_0275g00110 [Botryotinia narcissicola]